MRLLIFLIIVFQSLIYCNKNKSEKNSEIIKNKETTKIKIEDSEFLKFIKTLEIKKIPYQENSNFDEFDKYKKLSEKEFKILSLKKIGNNLLEPKVKYRVEISESFYSVVIVYKINDQELYAELVNYSIDGKLIDHLKISYDEIAESLLYINSDISKDKIVLNNKQYYGEGDEAIVETNDVKINANGTFTLLTKN